MITIYSKKNCPQCVQSKEYLKSKDISFNEYYIDDGTGQDEDKKYISLKELKEKAPLARMAPVIFKGETYIGSYKELLKNI